LFDLNFFGIYLLGISEGYQNQDISEFQDRNFLSLFVNYTERTILPKLAENLARYRFENNFVVINNYIKRVDNNTAKSFDILATSPT